MKNKTLVSCIIIFALMLLIGVIIGLILLVSNQKDEEGGPSESEVTSKEIKRFASSDDFKRFLEKGEAASVGSSQGISRNLSGQEIDMDGEASPTTNGDSEDGGQEKRVSGTNVQVEGIDEPDIVKSDGTYIYSSQTNYYYYTDDLLFEESTTSSKAEEMPVEPDENPEIAPRQPQQKTNIVKATPPDELKKTKSIDKTGDLLLHNDMLFIFGYNDISSYNVEDPSNPKADWTYQIEENNTVVDARLYKDKIYLVIKSQIQRSQPCPVALLSTNKDTISMPCTDIYYPNVAVDTDVTYSVLILDPTNGNIDKKVSFIGTSDFSIMYMSENSIYVTYTYFKEFLPFIVDFINEKAQDLISDEIRGKINDVMKYDISTQAKMTEIEVILDTYLNSLPVDEQSRIENEMSTRMEAYYKEHVRELEKTGIVKIANETLDISKNGTVPGRPLNQFSLDEYEGSLRIATTSGGSMWSSQGSVNDVYVLNESLEETGSITNMGIDERIYSVRFIGDKGYVVTFKITDPFYVLDLTDPTNPKKEGELKIPGYSSYLHPVTKDKILGVGMENQNVKLSLFDVSDPKNPTEVSKYQLEEYWTDVAETHHAFLLDLKHGVFFIPAGDKGYIFSFQNDTLEVKKKISDIQAKRALYIDDYLYIVGEDKIVVLDETNWTQVNSLSLEEKIQ